MFKLVKDSSNAAQQAYKDDEDAWAEFTKSKHLHPPRWLLKKMITRHRILRVKANAEKEIADAGGIGIPSLPFTGADRLKLKELDTILTNLALKYSASGDNDSDAIYNVPELYPPRRPTRDVAGVGPFLVSDGDKSDLALYLESVAKKEKVEVSAMYDDHAVVLRPTKTAAGFWSLEKEHLLDTKFGYLNPDFKGLDAEEFARCTYPAVLKDRNCLVSQLGDNEKKEDWKLVVNSKSKGLDYSLSKAVECDNLQDLTNTAEKQGCVAEIAATRHSSFNASSRGKHGVRKVDEFEIACKDWEIELNILTDRSLYPNAQKVVFQRPRMDRVLLKQMHVNDTYDGRDLMEWGHWTRLESHQEVVDVPPNGVIEPAKGPHLVHTWTEGKVTFSKQLVDLREKVARKKSENNMLKYRNELVMQMLTCAQMELEKFELELEYAHGPEFARY